MHSLGLPAGLIFVRVSGGQKLSFFFLCSRRRVEIRDTLSGYRVNTVIPVGSLESPGLMPYCICLWIVGGNWSILKEPTKNVEEREPPNKNRTTLRVTDDMYDAFFL